MKVNTLPSQVGNSYYTHGRERYCSSRAVLYDDANQILISTEHLQLTRATTMAGGTFWRSSVRDACLPRAEKYEQATVWYDGYFCKREGLDYYIAANCLVLEDLQPPAYL
jgi:hypothetical protein